MFKRLRAQRLNAEATALKDRGQYEQAAVLYRRAIEMDPSWSSSHYNLGLVFKLQGNWAESLTANQQAVELDRTNEAAWWNLGIAATALARWDIARKAWRGFGIKVPAGDGPIDLPCGFGPIRINPRGDAEVVWAQRIDPARAVLASIPFPETGHRWQDLVLNDGTPTGYRQHQGQQVPVFDELELLASSRFGTYVARVEISPEPPALAGAADHDERLLALAEVAARLNGSMEDWTTSVRPICKACSEGRPHTTHDYVPRLVQGVHSIGIAANSRKHAESILSLWEEAVESIRVESLDDGLEPGAG